MFFSSLENIANKVYGSLLKIDKPRAFFSKPYKKQKLIYSFSVVTLNNPYIGYIENLIIRPVVGA